MYLEAGDYISLIELWQSEFKKLILKSDNLNFQFYEKSTQSVDL